MDCQHKFTDHLTAFCTVYISVLHSTVRLTSNLNVLITIMYMSILRMYYLLELTIISMNVLITNLVLCKI